MCTHQKMGFQQLPAAKFVNNFYLLKKKLKAHLFAAQIFSGWGGGVGAGRFGASNNNLSF